MGTGHDRNVGRPFAIILDKKVVSAPRINEPITGGQSQISGNFTVQSANDLAILLRAGALPAKLTVIEQRVVGAGLGQDFIQKGTIAAYYGAILVAVYMLAAYGVFGVFAVIAVAFNVAMIFGVLSLLNATLTLPGIIGIVLTIGIAVDPNVLIYERIREEVRNGRSAISGNRRRVHAGACDHHGLQYYDLHRGGGAILHRHGAGERLRRDVWGGHRHHRVHGLHPDALAGVLLGALVASAAACGHIGARRPVRNHALVRGLQLRQLLRLLGRDPERLRPLEQEPQRRPAHAQNSTSAPTMPASVTSAEIVPMSVIQPYLSSTVRLAAMPRKKAR